MVFVLLISIPAVATASGTAPVTSGPAVYLNFNEGSGSSALDASGNGNTGTIHGNVLRVENSGCVKALMLDGNANYVSIPYTSQNHPTDAITVSLWFYVNNTAPQTLISTYDDGGGYGLDSVTGTISGGRWPLIIRGDVSVVIPHESIHSGNGTT